MLDLPMNYNELESCDYIETDCEKVCEHLADADLLVTIDTCTLCKYYQYKDDRFPKVIKYIKRKYDGNIVILFTETFLSEFFKSTGNKVTTKFKQILQMLHEEFVVVLFKEEQLALWRKAMVNDDISVINQNFIDILNEHRAQLMTIDKYLAFDDNTYKAVIFDNDTIATNEDVFIQVVINFIKSKKTNKDSLAEQLLMLIVTFVMDLYHYDNCEIHSFLFITDDRRASGRVKDIQNHSDMFSDVFRFITLPYLVREMQDFGVFEENELKDFLECMVRSDPFKVTTMRDGVLQMTEITISVEEFVDKIKNDTKFKVVY